MRVIKAYEDHRQQHGQQIDFPRFEQAVRGVGIMPRFGWTKSDKSLLAWRSRSAKAFISAFVLQTFTGWSGFLIAYTTPTVGIGCRGFTLLIYNIFSLLACASLIAASWLSDKQSQKPHDQDEEMQDFIPGVNGRQVQRDSHWGEIALRAFGKSIACLNAVLLISSCMLEFFGVYNNCFCGSSRMGLGGKAYIVFLSPEEESQPAAVPWTVGLIMTLAPCICYIIYFSVAGLRKKG
jgi:hypothetical protein